MKGEQREGKKIERKETRSLFLEDEKKWQSQNQPDYG